MSDPSQTPGATPPPPGSPPPSPPAGSGGSGGALDRVTGWFSEGWNQFQPELVNLGLAALVYYLVLTVATLACLVPGLVVAGPLAAGMWIVAAYRVLGRRVDIGQVFLGFRRFVPTFLLGLLYFAVPLLILALIIVPFVLSMLAAAGAGSGAEASEAAGLLAGGLGCGMTVVLVLFALLYPLVVALFFLFSLPLVLFKNQGVGEALSTSFATCRAHFGTVFLLVLGAGGLYMIGASVSSSIPFVGLLLGPLVTAVTIAYLAVVLTVAYRDLFGLTEADLAPYEARR